MSGEMDDLRFGIAFREEAISKFRAEIEQLRAALRSMRELASVSIEGDPWYAEDAGLNVDEIFRQAREALWESPRASDGQVGPITQQSPGNTLPPGNGGGSTP